MAVLLIGMAITAVTMTAALPAWRQQAQRERELELIFRGEQYARSIALYYKKNAQLPPDFDVLVQGHYLRKKWKDPITGDDFLPMMAGGAAGTAPGGVQGAPNVPNQPPRSGTPSSPSVPAPSAPGGAPQGQPNRGTGPGGVPTGGPQPGGQQALSGIAGVSSKSTATSIIIYAQLQQHNLWPFTYQTGCQKLLSGCPQGNNNQNNRQGGQPGRGGPGATGPGRGGDTAGPGGLNVSPGGRTPPPASGRGGDLGIPVTGRGRGGL